MVPEKDILPIAFVAAHSKLEDKETGWLSLINILESLAMPESIASGATAAAPPFVLLAWWRAASDEARRHEYLFELRRRSPGDEDFEKILSSEFRFTKPGHRFFIKLDGMPLNAITGILWFEARVRVKARDDSENGWVAQRYPISIEQRKQPDSD